jgi:VIT1/CCC1 family predicted Fe2+/Mn2+ transporter
MKRSTFLQLNLRDFFKGLVLAILAAVITWAYEAVQAGTLFDPESLKNVGMVALAAVLAYLVKNLLTNSQGEIATPEPK